MLIKNLENILPKKTGQKIHSMYNIELPVPGSAIQ